MRFPKTLVCVVAFAALFSVGRSAQSQTTYEISVVLDDSTAADGDLLNAAVLAAPSGEAVQSIRKLAAGLMLEVRLLVQQRVQDRILTLDDGVQVPLMEGDSIKANMKKRCTSLECDSNDAGDSVPHVPGSGTPSFILIYKDGVCARSLWFPSPGDGHKPLVRRGASRRSSTELATAQKSPSPFSPSTPGCHMARTCDLFRLTTDRRPTVAALFTANSIISCARD